MDVCPSTVLVTGASGLLGSAIAAELQSRTTVIGVGNRNVGAHRLGIDFLGDGYLDGVRKLPWTAIVHCAAFRSPDYCEAHQDLAWRLNADVPAALAGEASKRGAAFVHISTDYVFGGDRAPYAEDDPVAPVNYYGRTKVAAEQGVRAAHADALILRVPALYGEPEPPVVSSLVEEMCEAALSNETVRLDNRIVRYPTHVADIARIVCGALCRGMGGILQASAPQSATRYELAVLACGWIGCGAGHLQPDTRPPVNKAVRPVNCALRTARLEACGLPVPRPFGELLPPICRRRAGMRRPAT